MVRDNGIRPPVQIVPSTKFNGRFFGSPEKASKDSSTDPRVPHGRRQGKAQHVGIAANPLALAAVSASSSFLQRASAAINHSSMKKAPRSVRTPTFKDRPTAMRDAKTPSSAEHERRRSLQLANESLEASRFLESKLFVHQLTAKGSVELCPYGERHMQDESKGGSKITGSSTARLHKEAVRTIRGPSKDLSLPMGPAATLGKQNKWRCQTFPEDEMKERLFQEAEDAQAIEHREGGASPVLNAIPGILLDTCTAYNGWRPAEFMPQSGNLHLTQGQRSIVMGQLRNNNKAAAKEQGSHSWDTEAVQNLLRETSLSNSHTEMEQESGRELVFGDVPPGIQMDPAITHVGSRLQYAWARDSATGQKIAGMGDGTAGGGGPPLAMPEVRRLLQQKLQRELHRTSTTQYHDPPGPQDDASTTHPPARAIPSYPTHHADQRSQQDPSQAQLIKLSNPNALAQGHGHQLPLKTGAVGMPHMDASHGHAVLTHTNSSSSVTLSTWQPPPSDLIRLGAMRACSTPPTGANKYRAKSSRRSPGYMDDTNNMIMSRSLTHGVMLHPSDPTPHPGGARMVRHTLAGRLTGLAAGALPSSGMASAAVSGPSINLRGGLASAAVSGPSINLRGGLSSAAVSGPSINLGPPGEEPSKAVRMAILKAKRRVVQRKENRDAMQRAVEGKNASEGMDNAAAAEEARREAQQRLIRQRMEARRQEEEREREETEEKDRLRLDREAAVEERRNKYKYWYISKGNGFQILNELRKAMGHERIRFEDKGATHFYLKWVQIEESVDWSTFNGSKQLVDYVQGSKLLTNKRNLVRTLLEYEKSTGVDVSFHPRTFQMSENEDKAELAASLALGVESRDRLLIVKPSGMNKGNGIAVWTGAEVAETMMKTEAEGGWPEDYIVQEYIAKPLLLNGCKFDMRCYACIVSAMPYSVVFWPRGYIRTAMVQYSVDNFKDLTAHLTNVAIQRQNEDFDEKSEGSIWDYDQFQAYLNKRKLAPEDYVTKSLVEQMAHIMKHCALSIKDKVRQEIGQFQLLGFDLMVDTELKLHLIEVNRNPDLSCHTSVLKATIPPVLEEIIGMVTEAHSKQVVDPSGSKSIFPLTANTTARILIPES